MMAASNADFNFTSLERHDSDHTEIRDGIQALSMIRRLSVWIAATF
jgi:hypothetical protein